MKRLMRPLALFVLLLLLLSAVSCGSTAAEGDADTTRPDTTAPPVDGETTADPSITVIPEGRMIFYEDFDSYGTVSGTDATLAALRGNGVWRLDDQSNPYYPSSLSYTAKSTCTYAIEDGALKIRGYKNADGSKISSPVDTYLVVADENTLGEVFGERYTIRYDITYESYANLRRYVAVVWNYYGQHYNSFHLRVEGTGNLQSHRAGAWLDLDRYTPITDLYAPATDSSDGSSIAMKLLGIDLYGSPSEAVFEDITVTVVLRVSEDGSATVWLSLDGGETLVKVSRFDQKSDGSEGFNAHASKCNGGAIAIKTGAGINGTLDNLMVYTGHGDVPSDKTTE